MGITARIDLEPNDHPFDAETMAAAERAGRLDRAWFERRPTRAYRLRKPMPGEGPVGGTNMVLIKQIAPGTRLRLPLHMVRQGCTCNACLGEGWETFAPAEAKRIAIEMAAAAMKEGP